MWETLLPSLVARAGVIDPEDLKLAAAMVSASLECPEEPFGRVETPPVPAVETDLDAGAPPTAPGPEYDAIESGDRPAAA